MSSLANGQGDRAVHGRLRYRLRRDERRAAGFAELLSRVTALVVQLRNGRKGGAYCATLSFVADRTVANSLMRCGRFPVFSSCSMTAITISSLIPSVSIFGTSGTSPGDGGGVCSAGPRRLCGLRSTSSSFGEVALEMGEEIGVMSSSSGDRLTLFEGGGSISAVGVDLEF